MLQPHQFQAASFVTSAAAQKGYPPDQGREVAFVGRSNAGKSTALNAICGRKALARTSKTPGRTQLINFFELDEQTRLVDLPGYGYAKAPPRELRKWGEMVRDYFEHRKSLCGVIMMMDCRRPLTPNDEGLLEWIMPFNLPLHILLTKADKIKRGPMLQALHQINKALPQASAQAFSAPKQQGIDEARAQLSNWLCND